MDFEQYYVEASLLLASVLGGLALKDYSVSFINGLKFKLNSQFNEVDKDLHADSAHEKAMKLQKILEGKDGD